MLIIYVIYLITLTCGSYYIHLFISKEQFTRDDLKHIAPYLMQYWNKISGSHSIFMLVIVSILSSAVGAVIPMISHHWLLNSSILFLVMFFLFPTMKGSIDRIQVTTGGDFSDTVANAFSKYHSFIIIGFGSGTATALMYNWGALKVIGFLWFMLNFVLLTFFIGAEMIKALKQN
ncbi:MAG: hypothetical protein E4G96_03195 [Chrysiogenales bacterium]|nr:MAG: hypothetical protein E4G96_03195 [Chrysiogenales bacterium]